VCFDQNDDILTNTKQKKGCQTTIVHHLQRLYLKGCSGGYFQWHLMLHLSTKQDKQDTTLMV
jgi:hypothetical protein